MRFVFDIDGTVCDTIGGNYKASKPKEDMIKLINQLYDGGHYVCFYTARGMGTLKGNKKDVHAAWYDFTFNQLKSWGIKFNELIMCKPEGDLFIDDKAFGVDGKVNPKELEKYLYNNFFKREY